MFGHVFRMELKRSCSLPKFLAVMISVVIVLLLSCWRDFALDQMFLMSVPRSRKVGSYNILETILNINRFTVIIVFLLSGLHTGSFCKDDGHYYLRMILSRTNITTFTQCRFLSNMLSVCLLCTASFYLFVLILLPGLPIVNAEDTMLSSSYYAELILRAPVVFVGMTALQFGMVVSACCSIGLLYSAFRPNQFVSIGISGMSFYAATSFLNSYTAGSAFHVQNMISMAPCLGPELPWQVNYAWGLLLPALVIAACGYLFYRRMKWRVEHGYI